MFDELYGHLTQNLTVERTAFFIRIGLYGLFGLMVIAVNLVFDYAKIRAVVEDRRSMLGALIAAFRFVRRRPTSTFGLYFINGGFFAGVLIGYAIVTPSPTGSDLAVWPPFSWDRPISWRACLRNSCSTRRRPPIFRAS